MKKSSAARIFQISATIIVVLAVLMLAGCGKGEFVPYESLEEDDSYEEIAVDETYEPIEPTVPMTTEEVIKAKKLKQFIRNDANTSIIKEGDIKNILIIGQDRRDGDKQEMRSDCMMIFSINMVTNEINLVSLMRDMYIPCADGKDGMINMTYLNGGIELLSKTIEMNFGVHIDNYIETDFWRFMDLFDLIGPVDVELTGEEAAYLNDMTKNVRRPHYDYGDQAPVWTLHAGVNSLDSEQMLSFCRIRKDIGGDWGRTERQRRFILATYNKLDNMSYAGLIRLIKEGGHYLSTDMGVVDMLGYFYHLKKNDFKVFNGYLIPLEGTYTQEVREETLHVLVPQIEPNKNAMQQYIYGATNATN